MGDLVAPGPLDVERAREILRSCRDVDTILEIRDRAKLAAEYMRLRKQGLGAINDAQELVVRAQRRFGEFLRDHGPKRGGDQKSKSHDETLISLNDLGVDKNESSRCQRLAAIAEAEFEQHLATVRSKGEKITTAGAIRATSDVEGYDSNEWYTPSEYIECVRAVLGEIELDPTSCNHAQKTVKATKFFRKEDDARTRAWRGKVYMNPPYTQPLISELIQQLLRTYERGDVPEAIVLTNNATETQSIQTLLNRFPSCFPDGRIQFERADGPKVGPRQGQVFFYLGPNIDRFFEVFSELGSVQIPLLMFQQVRA